MPHLSPEEANNLGRLPARILAAEERNRRDHLGAKVLVGSKLLRKLIEAHQRMERLHAAGWGVTDDGAPYRLDGD